MQSVEGSLALLGLNAMPLVLLDLHSHSWTDAHPGARTCWEISIECTFRVATFCSYDFV